MGEQAKKALENMQEMYRTADARAREAEARTELFDARTRHAEERLQSSNVLVQEAEERACCTRARTSHTSEQRLQGAEAQVRETDERACRAVTAEERQRAIDDTLRDVEERWRGIDDTLRGADSQLHATRAFAHGAEAAPVRASESRASGLSARSWDAEVRPQAWMPTRGWDEHVTTRDEEGPLGLAADVHTSCRNAVQGYREACDKALTARILLLQSASPPSEAFVRGPSGQKRQPARQASVHQESSCTAHLSPAERVMWSQSRPQDSSSFTSPQAKAGFNMPSLLRPSGAPRSKLDPDLQEYDRAAADRAALNVISQYERQ
eukprot:gnl/TRDRNA2_/TRDRNA2_174308_c0_seq1.p1 gnl/TRDRNA2_/TRDRNA2_174308_c0~~gnl/TRDRNA2_/TRDRNA2_174308_c0_seq1.p1  ORF type:complete len:323 (-),score=52.52 gnl/TRDRNA2_/TRDRNA2_174308_c0_seq1:15-983(-)